MTITNCLLYDEKQAALELKIYNIVSVVVFDDLQVWMGLGEGLTKVCPQLGPCGGQVA